MAIIFGGGGTDLGQLNTREGDAFFEDSANWGLGQPQQQPQQQAPPQQQQRAPQQQSPIVQAKAEAGNPLALPKDQETLARVVQQQVYNVIGGLAQTNQEKVNKLNDIKKSFLANEQYRPWYPAAEDHFNELIGQGHTIEQAANSSIRHVQNLARRGFQPPAPSKQSLVPSQFAAGHQLQGGAYRPDEDPNESQIYTEQQRAENHQKFIKHRRMHQEFIRSNGRTGKDLRELNPAAFE